MMYVYLMARITGKFMQKLSCITWSVSEYIINLSFIEISTNEMYSFQSLLILYNSKPYIDFIIITLYYVLKPHIICLITMHYVHKHCIICMGTYVHKPFIIYITTMQHVDNSSIVCNVTLHDVQSICPVLSIFIQNMMSTRRVLYVLLR